MKTATKLATLVILMASGVSTMSAAELSAEQLFTANCTACHTTARGSDKSQMVAPPISGALRHVKDKFDNKADAVAFMVDYIQNPSKDKAQCESKSIEKFGLMPSLKGVLTPQELERVSEYLYDNYPQGKGHGQGKGRGRGKGHGQGKGNGQGQGRMNRGM